MGPVARRAHSENRPRPRQEVSCACVDTFYNDVIDRLARSDSDNLGLDNRGCTVFPEWLRNCLIGVPKRK